MKTQANKFYYSPETNVMIVDSNSVLCASVNDQPQSATTEEWEEITL